MFNMNRLKLMLCSSDSLVTNCVVIVLNLLSVLLYYFCILSQFLFISIILCCSFVLRLTVTIFDYIVLLGISFVFVSIEMSIVSGFDSFLVMNSFVEIELFVISEDSVTKRLKFRSVVVVMKL